MGRRGSSTMRSRVGCAASAAPSAALCSCGRRVGASAAPAVRIALHAKPHCTGSERLHIGRRRNRPAGQFAMTRRSGARATPMTTTPTRRPSSRSSGTLAPSLLRLPLLRAPADPGLYDCPSVLGCGAPLSWACCRCQPATLRRRRAVGTPQLGKLSPPAPRVGEPPTALRVAAAAPMWPAAPVGVPPPWAPPPPPPGRRVL
jgi:hypothetical protein